MNNTIHRIFVLFFNRNGRRRAGLGTLTLAGLSLTALLTSAPAQVFESYTFTTNRVLPDGNAAGLADVRTLNSTISRIASVKAHLKIAGEFNGDVYAYLAHADGFCVLLNRVGRTAKNGAGYADYGFDVGFTLEAENGDIHQYQNGTMLKAGQPLTGDWQPDGRIADPAEVTDDSARESSLKSFLGLNAAGEWTLYLVDLESGGTNQLTEWGLEISGIATPTVAWPNPAAITYGTALSAEQLNASVTYNGTNVPGTFVYAPSAGTVLTAGARQSLSVTFTPQDSNSFEAITTSVVVDVAPAPLTITVNHTNKTYGASLPTFTVSYHGFVNGDSEAILDVPVTLTTPATASSPVGSYPIAGHGAGATNYAIRYVDGTLTVDAAVVTVAVQNASKSYGAPLPELSASYSGFVNGDDTNSLSALAKLTTTANASSDVGIYPITADAARGANYSFQYVAGVLTVTQAQTAAFLVSSANPVATGSSVAFTANVAAVAPGAGTPTGKVKLRIDGTEFGAEALVDGVATFTTDTLRHGSHTVALEYDGDLNFAVATAALASPQVINSAPVAGSDTVERYPKQGVKVHLSVLLANDRDADNDSLQIKLDAISSKGGQVTVNDNWVSYTPAPGFEDVDAFTYTITDDLGGSTVGTVAVRLKQDNEPGQNLTIADLGNGSVKIRGRGIPGRTYYFEYSDTLAPFNWQELAGAKVTADPNGVFEWVDSGLKGSRFYRSVYR